MKEQDVLRKIMMERRSIRRYTSDPVPDHAIAAMLEAGQWAPSAHNRQPWRFSILRTSDEKKKIVEAMAVRLRRDLTVDGRSEQSIRDEMHRSMLRFTTAPLLLLISMTMAEMDEHPDPEWQAAEETIMAIQSVAMAGISIQLAAHALGLGSCWHCAPLFCQKEVAEALGLPDEWLPQGLITIGSPAESRSSTRKDLSQLLGPPNA